jgi:hypothetical protein
MRFRSSVKRMACILTAMLFLVSACAETPATEPLANLPADLVSLPEALTGQRRVASLTCVVDELAVIQTDEHQGELMAWSPASDVLALVVPVNRHYGWYIGELVIYDPVQKADVYAGEDETVFGDLTWSTDGGRIAYVLLDQETKRYTIKIIDPATGAEVFVFTDMDAAKTDDFASMKGILAWQGANRLQVVSSCGTDCVRSFDFNPGALTLTPQNDLRQNEDFSLVATLDTESPDGRWQVTLDDKGNAWLTASDNQEVALLLAGEDVFEVKFSADSQYLSLRVNDRVAIHELGCVPE